jgi:toxin HigB-1
MVPHIAMRLDRRRRLGRRADGFLTPRSARSDTGVPRQSLDRSESFASRLAEDLFDDRITRETRSFPSELRRVARRKLSYLHDAAELGDLVAPPGNRLERLKGRWKGFHSIRINDQWRVVFRWQGGNACDVQLIDYD